jgi:circadian clock protein KaiC
MGVSGAGKTLTGLHFIFQGADRGEPGVIATLQENPVQLERIVRGFGWSLDHPGVELMYRSPIDFYLEEWFYDLLEAIERTGAQRVLIDGLADLRMGSADEVRFREYLYSLLQRCTTGGVSVMLTVETTHGRSTGVSDCGVSNLSDNTVLLELIPHRRRLARTITVIKTRGSHHDPAIREFVISGDGIVLGDVLERDGDMLAGDAR